MSAPPSNRPGSYPYQEVRPVPPVSPAGTVPPVLPLDPEPLEPSLLETVRTRRKPVPLWIPIIGIGCLVAALIFGLANFNQPQTQTQTTTPAAVITATEGATATPGAAASPTIVQIVVPPSTPTPQPANQPAPTVTAAPPPPTSQGPAQAVAPTVAPVAEPTATPRPAPTAPPAVPPTAMPTLPNQPEPTPTPAPPTATKAPAPTATLPPAQSQPAPAPTTPPTAGPSPTAAPPTQVPLNSQGLGLFKTEWEKWHGQGDPKDNGVYYENQKYLVMFFEDRIVRLERLYNPDPVTLDAARQESKNFLPEDAQLVQSYIGPDNVPVDLYKSETLKTYFASVTDPDFWKGGEPGNFIVQYRKSNQPNMFSAIVITLGNNPQQNP